MSKRCVKKFQITYLGQPEINQYDIVYIGFRRAVEKIVWFDVTMNDTMGVDIGECFLIRSENVVAGRPTHENPTCDFPGRFFRIPALGVDATQKLRARKKWKGKVVFVGSLVPAKAAVSLDEMM